MVQGGMSVVKCLLFVFNFIFVVCGITLIAVGAVAQTNGKPYTEFLGTKFVTAPTILIALGCIIFFIAFLGCFGAVKQNYCMVMTFGILLFLIFIIEISGGIAAYVYRGELDDLVQKNMFESLKQHKEDSKKLWEDMQMNWKCCGANSSADYTILHLDIPSSCCTKELNVTCKTDEIYTTGCHTALIQFIDSNITAVGGTGIGIAFIEILGMIFAWCLASAIKKEYEGV